MPNTHGGAFYCLGNCKTSVAQRRRHGSLSGDVIYTVRMVPQYDYAGEYIGDWPRFDWHTPGPIPAGAKVLEREIEKEMGPPHQGEKGIPSDPSEIVAH